MREWIEAAEDAVRACDGFVDTMRDKLAAPTEEDQRLLHGFAWYATTAAALSTALRRLSCWAEGSAAKHSEMAAANRERATSA